MPAQTTATTCLRAPARCAGILLLGLAGPVTAQGTEASPTAPIVDTSRPPAAWATAPDAPERVRPRSLQAPGRFHGGNTVTLPPLDVAALVAEDAARREAGIGGLRAGVIQEIEAITGSTGEWTPLDDGGWLWTVAVHAPGARMLRLRVPDFRPPAGAELVVFDGHQPEHAYGPVTRETRPEGGTFWSNVVFSDTLHLEYYLPPDLDPWRPDHWIRVDGIVNHYRGLDGAVDESVIEAVDGGCQLDSVCYPAWGLEALAVGRILVVISGGAQLCSGSLINRVPGDFSPLFLTAAHCGTVDFPASDVVVWFFQSPTCGGTPPDPGLLPQTMGSVNLLNALGGPDTALLGLRDDIPAGVPFLGWNANYLPNGSAGTVIHHKGGAQKQISFVDKVSDGPGCSGSAYNTTYGSGDGDLGQGASGAPLFDTEARVRGVVACGPEGNCGGSMNIGRFDVAYPLLQPWLAPADPVFCNAAATGTELGTSTSPFDSVGESMFAVIAGSTVHVAAGNYDEQLRIDRPMSLRAPNGGVRIGTRSSSSP